MRQNAGADRRAGCDAILTFHKIAPTIFENTDGYIVKGRNRDTLEYLEDPKRAIVGVEFGIKSVCIFRNDVTGCFLDEHIIPLTESEKERVIERVSAAMQFDGLLVEISPR